MVSLAFTPNLCWMLLRFNLAAAVTAALGRYISRSLSSVLEVTVLEL